jgi:hypothetical protein
MFPSGLPGLALLLLRAAVAIALVAATCSHRQELAAWILSATILVSVAASVGYLTPLVATACLAFHVLIWVHVGVGSVAVAAIVCLDAVALALLGPGAYSVDSYRYGRREVILPPP